MTPEALSARAPWPAAPPFLSPTVALLSARAAARDGERVALRHRAEGRWESLSFAELHARVQRFARGLIAAGVMPADRVALWSANRPEWLVADLAIAAVGAIVVPVPATSAPAEAAWAIGRAGARMAICDDALQAAELTRRCAELPELESTVLLDRSACGAGATPLCRLLSRGDAVDERAVETRAVAVEAADVYRIAFTPATRGRRRGCVLTHGSFASAIRMRASVDPVGPGDVVFLALPLAHASGLASQLAALEHGATTALADGDAASLAPRLPEVAPTHLVVGPRFAEALHARVAQGRDAAEIGAAVRAAEEAAALRARGAEPPPALAAQLARADLELFALARAATGGRVRRAEVVGEPLATELLRFFRAAGVLHVQGHGTAETAGVATASTPDAYRFGSIGRPVPGVTVRVAEDGELLLRGPNLLRGYLGDEGADDEDGWLHTGERARIDADGFVTLTDRRPAAVATVRDWRRGRVPLVPRPHATRSTHA